MFGKILLDFLISMFHIFWIAKEKNYKEIYF